MTDPQGVLDTAGSRYTYSANPLALLTAAEQGLSNVALVGMSCQASVTASMEARRVNKWRKKIAWTFGLLCSKTFTYDGLMVEIAQRELGIDLDHLVRVNARQAALLHRHRRRADVLAEGVPPVHSAGLPAMPGLRRRARRHLVRWPRAVRGWTPTIVRTDRGADIWARALADGVVEARSAAEDPKAVDLMFKLAARSRARWPSGAGRGRHARHRPRPRSDRGTSYTAGSPSPIHTA